MNEPLDLQQVRREIEAEVRARRATGEYPPGFERELDALFARFAPPEVSEDFDAALERAEETVALDPVIPTASNSPIFGIVKRVVAKLVGWYHAWLAQELTAFGAVLTNALRLLGKRVSHLEHVTADTARARTTAMLVPATRDDAAWSNLVVERLRACDARVAVVECGEGVLVQSLLDAGVDAYGVEPRAETADAALERGIEVRIDDGAGHLRRVAPASLGAVVLRGVVERAPVGELLQLVDAAAAALRPNGVMLVCSLRDSGWRTGPTVVEADLALGHPLHPDTWCAVLPEQGFVDVSATAAGANAYVVTGTRAAGS
jgi:hypothetical protein